MTFRKYLIVFLILLLVLPLVSIAHAGSGDKSEKNILGTK